MALCVPNFFSHHETDYTEVPDISNIIFSLKMGEETCDIIDVIRGVLAFELGVQSQIFWENNFFWRRRNFG